MDIGRRIRAVREDLGMPQAELARRAGVASNTIYLIETDRRRPSVGLLEKIARELRTEPAELMRESALPLADASGAGQPGQEWARELDVTLHGMTDEEWGHFVESLASKEEIVQAFKDIVAEAEVLRDALRLDKINRPAGRVRRQQLSEGLRNIRIRRLGDLASEAILKHARDLVDEIFHEMTEEVEA